MTGNEAFRRAGYGCGTNFDFLEVQISRILKTCPYINPL